MRCLYLVQYDKGHLGTTELCMEHDGSKQRNYTLDCIKHVCSVRQSLRRFYFKIYIYQSYAEIDSCLYQLAETY